MKRDVRLEGRLGNPPAIRQTQNGGTILSMSVAVNERPKEGREPKTHWFKVVVFGRGADTLKDRLQKGQLVIVDGELAQESWTDKEGKTRADVVVHAFWVSVVHEFKEQGRPAHGSDDFGDIPF